MTNRERLIAILLLVVPLVSAYAQQRLVIVDQDGTGPADANQMAMLLLLQSPQVKVLGLTIVTGDGWRDEEVAHTLRMLELTGHDDVPVAAGAVFPLVRTEDETRHAMAVTGSPAWLGAWRAETHGAWEIPPLPEGAPRSRALAEDAAHFLIRQVHAHPGEVTIVALGPLTNIALAIALDPRFAEVTRGIVLMGGSLDPRTDDPEVITNSRYEFNFWFDPEAAHNVLRAHWPRIEVVPVDASVRTMFTQELLDAIGRSSSPAAQYLVHFAKERTIMWDSVAVCAWLDPKIVTRSLDGFMDVDLSHGPSYGNTLTWTAAHRPATAVQPVHMVLDIDVAKFKAMLLELLQRSP